MRWPWRRKPAQPSHEARTALWQAQRALVDAERLDRAAAVVAERLRTTRSRNHFAERIEDAMRRA